MDLNKRLDLVDDELKLLKNEIKQVLLDIQEQVLTVQNPFLAMAAGPSFTGPKKDAEIVAKSEASSENLSIGPQSPEPRPQAPPPLAPPPQAPPPQAPPPQAPPPQAAAPPIPQPIAAPAPVASAPAYSTQVVMPPQAMSQPEREPAVIPPRRSRALIVDTKPAAVDDDPEDEAEEHEDEADEHENEADEHENEAEEAADDSPASTVTSVKTALESSSSGRRKKERAADSSADERSRRREARRPDKPTSKAPADKESGEREADATPDVTVPEGVDLATLAGLAVWTDQAVSKIGREQLEPLLELSEIRGRLSKGVKEIVLTLARLFEGLDPKAGLTAKEMVSLLAQLDALSGAGSSADAKILPFLIHGEMEGLPLTPP